MRSYLNPWYFKKHEPALVFGNFPLTWEYVEKINSEYAGITKLMRDGICLGVIRSYVYIQPLDNGSRFLVWRRNINKIELFDTATLTPITDQEMDIDAIKENKFDYLFKGEKTDLSFPINPRTEQQHVIFPREFKSIHEILVLTEIDGLYENAANSWHNTALLVLKPAEDLVNVYPQDWFNQNTNIDFGYQWITLARRNTLTQWIRLDGIRVDPQILDASHRQIHRIF